MSTLRFRLDEKIWRCILVFMFVIANSLFINSDKLVVKTKWGLVRGEWSRTMRNRSVANFLGIPYALPPVGNLRFRSPQQWNHTWMEIRDASIDGKKCIQSYMRRSYATYKPRTFKIDMKTEVTGSEDCLYLNIFVPNISGDRVRFVKLPVLVYVHGNMYKTEYSDSKLYTPEYLLDHDIILVTLNYRLSVLGFFSTANQISPGNYGLKDIKMALVWIQENIHSFGGNPKSVTLMGHSTGSAAIHILALSKKTEGLYHRYILLSGSALSPWSVHPQRTYRQVCLKLAKLVGCVPKKDDGELMKCMRTVDAKRIEIMTQYLTVWRGHPWYIFGPTLEEDSGDAILTMHPLEIMKNGLFRDIPAIMQVVKDEGLLKTSDLFTNSEVKNELIKNFQEYLPYYLEYHEVISNTSVFASAIQDFYFSGNVSQGLTHNITEMVSDAIITWPMFQTLQYLSKIGNSSIYFSYFAYEGTFMNIFALRVIVKNHDVAHGDNVNYLFPVLNYKYHHTVKNNSVSDITMINIMTEMWASFVTEGVPKARRTLAWPNYRDHHEFMRIGIEGSPDFAVQAYFFPDRMEFWEKLMQNKSAKSMKDVIVKKPSKITSNVRKPPKITNNANTIDHRLTIQLISLAILFCYM